MTIKTYSGFSYGHTITEDNRYINFNEGAGELLAEIEIGSYTLGSFVDAVAVAMNNIGTLTYSASLDRSNRLITIFSNTTFDLLISSGTQSGQSAFELMGFTGADLTGLITYTGDSDSGSFFEPQNKLQSFVDFEDNIKTISATVNQSASGIVEVVSYGKVKFMECNIIPQTNINQGFGSQIKTDSTGYENLRSFLNYCIEKAPIEFIPDISNPNTGVIDCLLESTRESKDGVNFKIKELYSKGYAFYFESGSLEFRELT